MPENDFLPEPEDIEIERANLSKLYSRGEALGINPERWIRVREQIIFSDLIYELTGRRTESISCPFHGRDSNPSFFIYSPARGNCAWCFGCPPGSQLYDSIRFTSLFLDINRVKALQWLEKTWNLPPLEDISPEDEEEERTITLEFTDVREPYIKFAKNDVKINNDPQLAEEYLRIYFTAEQEKQVLPIAKVLGKKAVEEILRNKG
jgi:hypothetical protein